MRPFKFLRNKENFHLPEGILNGYYNHNIPYDDLRPYYKSCCGVDVFSEIEATTYDELTKLEDWVNVWILGVLIDGVVYCSQNVGDEWEFPNNWEPNKKYIYEFMIITYPMLDQTNPDDDAWEEVVYEVNHEKIEELYPKREGRGVFIDLTNRITFLEDVIRYNM